MTDETAEQVIERVLGEHEYTIGPNRMACLCRWPLPRGIETSNQEVHRTHVAAELAAALREAGLLVEGETVTEWGVRISEDDPDYHPTGPARLGDGKRSVAERMVARSPETRRAITRQRTRYTRYPDRVTDWEEVR